MFGRVRGDLNILTQQMWQAGISILPQQVAAGGRATASHCLAAQLSWEAAAQNINTFPQVYLHPISLI